MLALPTGTVTFLFTDIEGSTRLWEEHPDAMRRALARHDALMRSAIEQHGGVVFKTIGDAFCAVFHTAPDALNAALTTQQGLNIESWPEPVTIKVRMALHTGAVEHRDNDYFGPPLNRVARLLAIGHGGQVLVSLVTEELIRDTLPPNASLWSLGEHRLRDLTRTEVVFQLAHPALPADFPPVRSLDSPILPNNLPRQLTSFIGREKEITEVKKLFDKTQLLTLTGSGGCGKTRFGLQVAAEMLEHYPDGVWLVELAPLADPTLAPQTIAQALGVKEQAGKTMQQVLHDSLKIKRLLLVLDNCEHLLSACAHLVSALLRACPNVKILATSREALGITGEQTYRVPSLSLPESKQPASPQSVSQSEAGSLFIERALLVKSDFVVSHTNAPVLAQICTRLEGIPLAIELAAARVRSLSVEEINSRLDNRFRLLTGGDRTASLRHQTLRATIDWSYDLLGEQEKLLLARMSVFSGGWTLTAAEQVGSGASIEEWEVVDLLTSLVDKSLVMASEQDGAVRYRILETVRQYAWEMLQRNGEGEAIHNRHWDWCMALAEEADKRFSWPERLIWLDQIALEHDNLRAALDWCLQSENRDLLNQGEDEESSRGAGEPGMRLASSLSYFWSFRGHCSEGREYLKRALGTEGAQGRTAVRARALSEAGSLAITEGDYAGARPPLEESLSLFRELGDRGQISTVLLHLGMVASGQGNNKVARTMHEESLSICRELGDKKAIAATLRSLGMVARDLGDNAYARTLYEESLGLSRELGDKRIAAYALLSLGSMAFDQQDYVEAQTRFEESLSLSRELGEIRATAYSLLNLGVVAFDQGDYVEARTRFEESLRLFREMKEKRGIANLLDGLARVFTANASVIKSVRLWGAVAAIRESMGTTLQPIDQAKLDQQLAQARSDLGENACNSAWEEGFTMTWEQAVAYALETESAQ